MNLVKKEIKVKLTLIEDMLGTAPSDPELYATYVASKAPDAPTMEQEIEDFGVKEIADKPRTVFYTDENGELIMYDYQIKGFFKDTCGGLWKEKSTESAKLTAYKKTIDKLVFIKERKILIEDIKDIKDCQRPLRAATPQGERVAIAVSDAVAAGATMTFTIQLLKGSLEKVVREWLDYGQFSGLGQWRNSGKGRFTYEILDTIKYAEDGLEELKRPTRRGRKAAEAESESEE